VHQADISWTQNKNAGSLRTEISKKGGGRRKGKFLPIFGEKGERAFEKTCRGIQGKR